MTKHITILAHDPGTRNYGLAVVRATVRSKRWKVDVLWNGMLQNPVRQLKSSRELKLGLKKYLKEAMKPVKKFKPDGYVAERFQTRGVKGMTIECVSMMLATLINELQIPAKLIIASQWKIELKKWGVDLEKIYKKTRVQDHQVDAAMMCVYAIIKILKARRQKLKVKKLLRQLERTSATRLINRRT